MEMIGKKKTDNCECQKKKKKSKEREIHKEHREILKGSNSKWPPDNLYYLTKNEIGLRQIDEFVKLTNRFT